MKAYLLLEVEVHDPEAYRRYAAAAAPLVARYGGRFLVRGQSELLEGGPPPKRLVLVEFPDEARLRAFWTSPEYRRLAADRRVAASARVLLLYGMAEDGGRSPTPSASRSAGT